MPGDCHKRRGRAGGGGGNPAHLIFTVALDPRVEGAVLLLLHLRDSVVALGLVLLRLLVVLAALTDARGPAGVAEREADAVALEAAGAVAPA
eukprot:1651483-Pleurochrysis_carterae.AAC.1